MPAQSSMDFLTQALAFAKRGVGLLLIRVSRATAPRQGKRGRIVVDWLPHPSHRPAEKGEGGS
jgi:hypothetical protein